MPDLAPDWPVPSDRREPSSSVLSPDSRPPDSPALSQESLWQGILAELERHARSAVNGAVTDAAADPPPWTPPLGAGQIPAALVERARAILVTQLDAARRLEMLRDSTRQHLAAVRGLAPAASGSVYLDVRG